MNAEEQFLATRWQHEGISIQLPLALAKAPVPILKWGIIQHSSIEQNKSLPSTFNSVTEKNVESKSNYLYYQHPAEFCFPKHQSTEKQEKGTPVTDLKNEGVMGRDRVSHHECVARKKKKSRGNKEHRLKTEDEYAVQEKIWRTYWLS